MKILPKEGDKSTISGAKIKATLRWKTNVDLDLHCFYLLKNQEVKKKGILSKILKMLGWNGNEYENDNNGHIGFQNKGYKNATPYIWLDKDSGIGDRGGNNEENIFFEDLSSISHALIVANIFNKNTNFSKYDGEVIVTSQTQTIKVPLTCKTLGSWCVIARIDNEYIPHLINVNKTMKNKPDISEFI